MVLELAAGAVVWRQEGSRLSLGTPRRTVHFDMPPGWSMAETHPDLFRAAAAFLVGRWIPGTLDGWEGSRRPGRRPGLAFSGGTDSTASMLVMPDDTALVYHERDFASRLHHDNAHALFDHLERHPGRRVLRVPSDHELLRTDHDLPPGFSEDMAVLVDLLLLADFLDLDAVGTGMVLCSAYFERGLRYRDFAGTALVTALVPRLRGLGLGMYFPIAGCHGVVTQEICRQAGLADLAIGCVRAAGGCGRCGKCFRAAVRLGRPFRADRALADQIARPDMHACTYLQVIAQARKQGTRLPRKVRRHPLVRRNRDKDMTVFEGHYPPALDLVPARYREATRERLERFVPAMPSPYAIAGWDLAAGSSPFSGTGH